MSRRDEVVLDRFRQLQAECLRGETTDEDRREHRINVARQRARDDAERQPSPQLPLEQAA